MVLVTLDSRLSVSETDGGCRFITLLCLLRCLNDYSKLSPTNPDACGRGKQFYDSFDKRPEALPVSLVAVDKRLPVSFQEVLWLNSLKHARKHYFFKIIRHYYFKLKFFYFFFQASVYSQFPSISMNSSAEDIVKLQNMVTENIQLKGMSDFFPLFLLFFLIAMAFIHC